MADCEICGKPNANKRAEIEGTILTVCEDCAKLGEVKPTPSKEKPKTKNKKRRVKKSLPKSDRELKVNCSSIVKEAREKEDLKREDLAQRLNIKESVIAKIENGKVRPPLDIAEKLEKGLNIELITKATESEGSKSKGNSENLTIGDVADIK